MLLSLLWLVALTNAFNLLDNMDGLAAGVAAIAAIGTVLLFASTGASTPPGSAAALAGRLRRVPPPQLPSRADVHG